MLCGSLLQNLLSERQENYFFSILADRASDCSNQEQLSTVIRYVGSDCFVREGFLGFLHCDLGLSGKAFAETVLVGLADLDINIRKCCGQSYDGATAVSGCINLHIFVKLTVKQYIPNATVTALI